MPCVSEAKPCARWSQIIFWVFSRLSGGRPIWRTHVSARNFSEVCACRPCCNGEFTTSCTNISKAGWRRQCAPRDVRKCMGLAPNAWRIHRPPTPIQRTDRVNHFVFPSSHGGTYFADFIATPHLVLCNILPCQAWERFCRHCLYGAVLTTTAGASNSPA